MLYDLRRQLHRRMVWSRRRLRLGLPHVALFGVLFGLLLGAVLAVPLTRTALIAPGLPSPTTVEASRDVTYTSEIATRQEQQRARNDPKHIAYRTDEQLIPAQRQLLVDTLNEIMVVRSDPTLDSTQRIGAITRLASVALSPEQALRIVQLSNDQWQRLADEMRRLYDEITRQRGNALTEEVVTELRERTLPYLMQPSDFNQAQRDLLIYFTSAFLRANRTLDPQATERNRAAAEAAVLPVTRSLVRGQNVVRRGDIVSDTTFEELAQLGVVRGAGGLTATLQQFLLGILVAWVFVAYLRTCQKQLLVNGRALAVVGGLLIFALLAARLLLPTWEGVPYAFPFATIGILLAVVFNSELALVATLMFAPLVGLQHESALGLTVTLMLGSAAGIFTTKRAQRTVTFAWGGFAVIVLTILSALVFWLPDPGNLRWSWAQLSANPVLTILLFSILNGALSAILALGTATFLGRAAHVVTPLVLMELSHPNHPLLQRLAHEAPGTYHHSMVMSSLAEFAAERIGADALLTRVGAYYHDVGKMLRPYFFTDNQHDRSNVHDQLDAKTSATIIIDHVREGEKLAKQYKLPQQIIDFIPQHHGTNVVSYFYRRALQEDEEADIESFCYPGPKPQTREAAIMMLADGVEATVRAKSQAGKLEPASTDDDRSGKGHTIADTVDQIINERIAARQLDESPLTLHDIALIKESFVLTLQGIYHPRVDYTQGRVKTAA